MSEVGLLIINILRIHYLFKNNRLPEIRESPRKIWVTIPIDRGEISPTQKKSEMCPRRSSNEIQNCLDAFEILVKYRN